MPHMLIQASLARERARALRTCKSLARMRRPDVVPQQAVRFEPHVTVGALVREFRTFMRWLATLTKRRKIVRELPMKLAPGSGCE